MVNNQGDLRFWDAQPQVLVSRLGMARGRSHASSKVGALTFTRVVYGAPCTVPFARLQCTRDQATYASMDGL